EPEARALVALRELALDLLEWPAEPLEGVAWNADPVVGDADDHRAADGAAAQPHASALGRELDGVGQEVEDDLLDRAAVSHHSQIGIEFGDECYLLLAGASADDARGFREQDVQIERRPLDAHAPSLDLRHVEHVIDDVEQVGSALADVPAVLVV